MPLVMSKTNQEAHPHWTATLISITGDITHASGDITTEPGNITGDTTRGYPLHQRYQPASLAMPPKRNVTLLEDLNSMLFLGFNSFLHFNASSWFQRIYSLQCFISLECWTSPRMEEVLHMLASLYLSSFSSVSKPALTFKAFLDFESFP